MKIYQIHECGGEYEDTFDNIVGTYLSKDKAKEKMAALEEENEREAESYRKCRCCPACTTLSVSEDVIQEIKTYCSNFSRYDAEYEEEYGVDCKNCITYMTYVSYWIEEIEVEI